jgi:hypothetical protein
VRPADSSTAVPSNFEVTLTGKKKWLTPAEARVRRRDLDRRSYTRLVLLVLPAIVLLLAFMVYRELRGMPRRLSQTQKAFISRSISDHQRPIDVEHASDLESQTYADDFESAFGAGRWQVTHPFMYLGNWTEPGVLIVVRDMAAVPNDAVLLRNVLGQIGIPADMFASTNLVPDATGIMLYVGPRP